MKKPGVAVLTHPGEEHDLEAGDIGTVVHEYADGTAIEVEFASVDAQTIAVLTLDRTDVRQLQRGGILQARRRLAPR